MEDGIIRHIYKILKKKMILPILAFSFLLFIVFFAVIKCAKFKVNQKKRRGHYDNQNSR